MLEPSDHDATLEATRQPARVLQIIHLALMAGASFYFLFQLANPGPAFGGGEPDVSVPCLFAVVAMIVSPVLSSLVAAQAVGAAARGEPVAQHSEDGPTGQRSPDPLLSGLIGAYHSSHIAGMAILNGAVFLALFNMRTGVPDWYRLVPVGLLLLMAIGFPTLSRVVEWVSARRVEIKDDLPG